MTKRVHELTPEELERRRARDRERKRTPEALAYDRERRRRRKALGAAAPPEGFDVRRLTTDGSGKPIAVRSTPTVEPLRPHVPDGHVISGMSTLIGPNGTMLQWVMTRREEQSLQAWIDATPALLEPLKAQADPVPEPLTGPDDRMVGYVIGDAHIGMLTWAPESGAHFDLKIAERLMKDAIDYLFSVAPSTQRCLIANIGDLQHADNPTNATPEGGNKLDVDGRDLRVRRAVMRITRYYIDRALLKHQEVVFLNQPGNHDPYATLWLGVALDALYDREPRVTIDTSPAPRRMYEYGRNLIAITHKPQAGEDLGHVMAGEWPEAWGRTEHRVWLTGHVHHRSVRTSTVRADEKPGFEIETFGILAPRDAWHAGKAYLAKRRMTAIVWHRDYGEDTRYTVHVSRLGVDE